MERFNEKLQDMFLSTPVIVEADEKVIATTELRNVARVIESIEFLRSVNNTTEPLRYVVRLKHNIVSFEDKTRDGFPILFTFCPVLEGMPDDLFDDINTDCCTNNLNAEDLCEIQHDSHGEPFVEYETSREYLNQFAKI